MTIRVPLGDPSSARRYIRAGMRVPIPESGEDPVSSKLTRLLEDICCIRDRQLKTSTSTKRRASMNVNEQRNGRTVGNTLMSVVFAMLLMGASLLAGCGREA